MRVGVRVCNNLPQPQKSIKIIKMKYIGCRDDTVPKTVYTRRHCEEE